MMDWYFLLVPLLLIPIVLLFVFVGCKLDTESSITTFTPETDVRIFYKADLAARVVSFTATVTVRDAQGKKLGQPGNAATAGANAIDPDGGSLLVVVPVTSFAGSDSPLTTRQFAEERARGLQSPEVERRKGGRP